MGDYLSRFSAILMNPAVPVGIKKQEGLVDHNLLQQMAVRRSN
jgi:hypothetical protein